MAEKPAGGEASASSAAETAPGAPAVAEKKVLQMGGAVLRYADYRESRKGEDLTLVKLDLQRVHGDAKSVFAVLALFDGHNGSRAAKYAQEHLLENILNAIPPNLSRDEWLSAILRAIVAGFVKTDKDFLAIAKSSGTTVTFVIIDEWVVTVASVGDSRCILKSVNGAVSYLSADHRLDSNEDEVKRISNSGGRVQRVNIGNGVEIGPLRCWPGGLALSRSIGDRDVGPFIVPIPHVKQVKLSNAGGRIVIASDGVWDAVTPEVVVDSCKDDSPEDAAKKIVQLAIDATGLRDDTTCFVVDILPSGAEQAGGAKHPAPTGSSPDDAEVLFEDGTTLISERLDSPIYKTQDKFKLTECAICKVELSDGNGIPVRADSANVPLLCESCLEKKEYMEGIRKPKDPFGFAYDD